MIKPDIIVTQPSTVDFPIFRHMIRQYRHLFDKVIFSFSFCCTGKSLFSWMTSTMAQDDIICLPSSSSPGDWRDQAVNTALQLSKSSHVLFLEQDVLIHNVNMLEEIFKTDSPYLGFYDGCTLYNACVHYKKYPEELKKIRFHPAFVLIERQLLDQTSKDFSAKFPYDHFGKLYLDLLELGYSPNYIGEFNFFEPDDWEHLAGLTQNYLLLMRGEQPNYRLDRFVKYNQEALQLEIEQHPEFLQVILQASQLKI